MSVDSRGPSGEITVTFSRDQFAGISAEAQRLGLSVATYLLGIHAVQTGRITRQTFETVGKLFVRDDEILRELAK